MSMNSLENDDSFVILGSSPPPSIIMEASTIGTSMSLIPNPSLQTTESLQLNGVGSSPKTSLQNGAVSFHENAQGHSPTTSSKPVSMIDKSFASKIILGQIEAKSMQSSLFQQFPSLNASHVQEDDIVKLSCLVEEHQELKGESSTFNLNLIKK